MLDRFKDHIDIHYPHLRNGTFLLACSGGLDSVALAHLCAACNMDFVLAHCNFQLRGVASDEDENFVRDLATTLDKKIFVTHFPTMEYVVRHKLTVQIAARDLRYAWFTELMGEHGIKTLVTAHHADDSLETFLINLSRGTGIEGLVGIPSKTDTLARPFLIFSRAEILAYAQDKDLTWREDASNADTKYLRNNIRHNIVPFLKELHPTFLKNFLRAQEYLADTAAIAQTHIHRIRQQLFTREGDLEKVRISSLLDLEPVKTYLFYFFKDYGFAQWDDIYNLLTAASGKEIHSSTHRLLKDRKYLILREKTENDPVVFNIMENQGVMDIPVPLKLEEVDSLGETSPNILYVDKETLKYPLLVRKWEKGDYFCPFGMIGKKKVSKFFKDSKLDAFSKESQWLLCSGDNIVWIIGKRADDRFKVTERTHRILKIILK
ncbi:MAG TPA: tRNA lysidine(34) synthetase TilS [Arenibacter sp.]|nr:tRNA lysidine(34) synthetase TilS [Arenibacter sp.]